MNLNEAMQELKEHGYIIEDKESSKKYTLTEETTEINGHIVHRIKALKTFKNKTYGTIKAGELG